jgi:hypothetical protein
MSPSVSKNQAIAMNLAKAVQKGQATAKPGSPSAQIAGSMKPSDVSDFASTPQAGLPKRVAAPPQAPPVKRAKPKPVKKAKKKAGRPPMKVLDVGTMAKKYRF